MIFERSLNYDDIQIVPQYSEIKSRSDVVLGTNFLGKQISIPVSISNMNVLSNDRIIKKSHEHKIPIFLSRMKPIIEYKKQLLQNEFIEYSIPSIGIGTKYIKMMEEVLSFRKYDIWLLDVSHANNLYVIDFFKDIRRIFPHIKFVVGNVATADGVQRLQDVGVNSIKIGISGGYCCTTKNNTGVIRGMISTILDCIEVTNVPLIADGNIRGVNDICKAVAIGTELVMSGYLWASTKECADPKEPLYLGPSIGETCNKYYGNASTISKKEAGQEIKNIEGETKFVKVTGSFDDMVIKIKDGLASCCSYCNVRDIKNLSYNAKFETIS